MKIQNIPIPTLNGIPKIYYLNASKNAHREDFLVKNFSKWGITNYERICLDMYSEENYDEWKDLITDDNLIQTPSELSITLNHIKTIVDWYDNCDDDYCIIMEDCVDINLCEYWMFDWQTLINKLPYNWDCVQLFALFQKNIPMHLRPKDNSSKSACCYMITRHFAKKVKENHYNNNKYTFFINQRDKSVPEYEYGTLDNFIFDIGITYTLPVFNLNTDHLDEYDEIFKSSLLRLTSDAMKYWWQIKSRTFSMNEFFTYNKRLDWKMEVVFDIVKQEVYKDRDMKMLLWI